MGNAHKQVTKDGEGPRTFDSLAEFGRHARGPLHLAIGIFDGVHLGHRAVIHTAVGMAETDGGQAAVLTFHPHPSHLFRPQNPTRMIMEIESKTRFLLSEGIDYVIRLPFTPEFAAIEAEDFVAHLKRECPSLRTIHVGYNFRFGKGRVGDIPLLEKTAKAAGISVFSAERIRHNGEAVSSTRIREFLSTGEIDVANELLGHRYRSEGTVTPGQQLGRKLGFPTLNIEWAPECRPAYGVYAVRARRVEQTGPSAWVNAVANYGVRPTVDKQAGVPRLEVHLLSEEGTQWDAGDTLTVEWLHHLRPEQNFASVEALAEQIGKDRAAAIAYFNDGAPT